MKLLAPLFLFFALQVHAQVVEGILINQLNDPVADAYIINQSSGSHAHSNELGKFSISETHSGDTLVITHIGYKNEILILDKSMALEDLHINLQQVVFALDQVVIHNDIRSIHKITDIDLATDPVNSSQEVLRTVPGLLIGQHAGGGKAEQLFLRGFDIDHGTDVEITVDGIPVNMVSHAHGQGYADLHFVIPETIEEMDYGKGPYYADHGDFNTAGYVALKTKERLEKSEAQLEYGQFSTLRLLGMFNLLESKQEHDAWLAGEYLMTDGAFDSPQNFNRLNFMGKYSTSAAENQKFGLQVSYFTSKWDASGQIPQRAIDSGMITRFGAIDDTEGGQTSRLNIKGAYTRFLNENTSFTSQFFYSRYNFELYSNFTFFLEDPVNGDQIRQKESRDIFGFSSKVSKAWQKGHTGIMLNGALGLRYDNIDENELSHTANRQLTLERLAYGDVDQTNVYAYANSEFRFGQFTINPGLRVDLFKFDYKDHLDSLYSTQSATKIIANPKLNFVYVPTKKWQLFLKTGTGFHSNDSRVAVAQNGKEILPYAVGIDLGTNIKPIDRMYISTAFWYLFLQQEFVYVGDGAVVEPSGRTRRLGMDFSVRYQPLDWMYLNFNLNYAFARSIDDPEGANYIPLAPDLTSTGSVTVKSECGFSGGIQYRYLRTRPANEDNSIEAKGYFIVDMNAKYTWKRLQFGLVIENLFNSAWNETQFATETQLQFETEPVEEIHFTPGSPFFIKGFVGISF